MNRASRRRSGADRRRQRLLGLARARRRREWKGEHRFIAPRREPRLRRRLERRGRRGGRRRRRCCSTPTPSCSTTASTGSRPRRSSSAALVGRGCSNPDGSIQPSASGPRSASGRGCGRWSRPRSSRPRCAPAPSPTGSSAGCEVTWLTGACVAGPTDVLAGSARSTRRCTCSARTSTSACAPRPPGSRSWFDPAACRIVHHGQGSSTLAYGSREGWRPTGTLNWRAALRRAYGPRRERLGWMALRANLRLRLIAKRSSAAPPTATARRSRRWSRPAGARAATDWSSGGSGVAAGNPQRDAMDRRRGTLPATPPAPVATLSEVIR